MNKRLLNRLKINLNTYRLAVLTILFLSILTRFYNFPDRWGIGADNARDALIALEAIARHQLPLMGPFSSAGAFVTGGIYYWFIMVSYLILPFLISAPWILTGIISVLSVLLFLYLGKIMGGERFSIILGIFAVVCPQYIGTSIELGNPTFVTVFTVLTLIFFVLLWLKKKQKFALLTGLSLGLAINMHYQSINLLVLSFAVLFIANMSLKERFKSFILLVFGVFIISIPLFYWDSLQNFANIRNLLDYLLIGQYRIYVPNSWKIFLLTFMPNFWAKTVGHYYIVGLMLFMFSGIYFVNNFLKRKIPSHLAVIGIIFFVLLLISRMYRGERSDGYMLYLIPFILIFTAFLLNELLNNSFKIIKFFSILLIVFLFFTNLYFIFPSLSYKNNFIISQKIYSTLVKKYPSEKFSIYDHIHENYGYSMPLSLYLKFKNKVDVKGKKIGINCKGTRCPSSKLTIISDPIKVIEMTQVSKEDLEGTEGIWINVNPESVYNNQVVWLNNKNLKSTFSLKNYIIEKISL